MDEVIVKLLNNPKGIAMTNHNGHSHEMNQVLEASAVQNVNLLGVGDVVKSSGLWEQCGQDR